MADTKKPSAAAAPDFGDEAGPAAEVAPVAAMPATQTPAEMALELERLRKQVADLQATVNLAPEGLGVQYIGDPNETPMGKGKISGGKFVADENGQDVFHYMINLPPSGGTDIKLCGVPFYHGVGYFVYVDQLRSLREIVARTWAHESSIRGSNENFYRQEGLYQQTAGLSNHLRGPGGRR
jgi:hypothetical protein